MYPCPQPATHLLLHLKLQPDPTARSPSPADFFLLVEYTLLTLTSAALNVPVSA